MACWDISIEAFKQLHFWLTILLIIKAICGRLGQQNIDLSSFDMNIEQPRIKIDQNFPAQLPLVKERRPEEPGTLRQIVLELEI